MISRWNHNVETELGELSFFERPKSFLFDDFRLNLISHFQKILLNQDTWLAILDWFFGSRMKLEFEGAPEKIQWPWKMQITPTQFNVYNLYDIW